MYRCEPVPVQDSIDAMAEMEADGATPTVVLVNPLD